MVSSFSEAETSTLEGLNVAVSVLSLIGSVFIISVYSKFPDLHTFAFKLVFLVSLSDFFVSIAGVLGDAGGNKDSHLGANPALCYSQAIIFAYFELASMLWSVSIAFTLWKAFIKEDPEFGINRIEQFFPRYQAVCWGIPLVLTLLPLTTNSYGDTGGWCWIKDDETADHVWRFIQWYMPLIAGICFNIWVYIQINKKLAVLFSAQPDNAEGNRTMKRMKYYPLVLIVCNVPGGINAIYQMFTGGDLIMVLNVFHIMFAAFQGAANALVYGFTPQVKDRVLLWLSTFQNNSEDFQNLVERSREMNDSSGDIAALSVSDDNAVDIDEDDSIR